MRFCNLWGEIYYIYTHSTFVLRKNICEISISQSTYSGSIRFRCFFACIQENEARVFTFFTNHVAGAMHRYWKDVFPENFNTTLQTDDCIFKCGTLITAMQIAEIEVNLLWQLVRGKRQSTGGSTVVYFA